jgi:hypothetical protein
VGAHIAEIRVASPSQLCFALPFVLQCIFHPEKLIELKLYILISSTQKE